jgi:uncharacterized protein YjdB
MVASVSNGAGQQGRLQALAEGETTVRGTYQGQTASGVFDVTREKVSSITVTPATDTLPMGMRRQLQAMASYTDGRQIDVTLAGIWRSSDERAVTVGNAPNSRGQVVAVAAGKAQITVAFAGVEGSAIVAVQVPVTLTSVAIAPPNPTVMVGDSVQLNLIGTYSDGTTRNLTAGANPWARAPARP